MPVTPEQRAMLLDSLAAGVAIKAARVGAGLSEPDVRALVASDPEVAAAVAASEAARKVAATAVAGVEAGASRFAAAIAASAAKDAPAAPKAKPKAPAMPDPKPGAAFIRPADAAPELERWVKHRAAAEKLYGPGLFGLLQYQDDLLVARGMHRISGWWLGVFKAYFDARVDLPSLMWIVALCGRGSGKSTTLERLAIVVALFAPRSMPPTERWQWPFISILKEDARRRIFEIAKLLQLAYGIEAKPNSNLSIELDDASGNAIEFLSMASTVGAVSGPSTMGGTVDEAAKMRSAGANPDTDLIVSLAETSRARDHWIGVRCSSAWETRGAHHFSVVKGSNAVNFVASIGVDWIDVALQGLEDVAAWEAAQGNPRGAAQIRAWKRTLHAGSPNVPTWVANPTIPAIASRLLLETVSRDAEDEEIDATTFWLRECASMPLARDGGHDPALQIEGLAEANRALAAHVRGEVLVRRDDGSSVPPAKVVGAQPGDARYAGPEPSAGAAPFTSWDRRDVF